MGSRSRSRRSRRRAVTVSRRGKRAARPTARKTAPRRKAARGPAAFKSPGVVVSTVVGMAGQASFVPGALPGLLAFPQGVAVSGTSLYITLSNGVAVVQFVEQPMGTPPGY